LQVVLISKLLVRTEKCFWHGRLQALSCDGAEEGCNPAAPNAFDQQKEAVVGALFRMLVTTAAAESNHRPDKVPLFSSFASACISSVCLSTPMDRLACLNASLPMLPG
jgi:hypothetical protein